MAQTPSEAAKEAIWASQVTPVFMPGSDSVVDSAANSTATRTTLTDLAPELFERMAQFADLPSNRALRLVNKDCYSKVQRAFAQQHFQTLRVLFTSKESLTHGLEVSRHGTYANVVENVKVYMDQFCHPELLDEYEGLETVDSKEQNDRYQEVQELISSRLDSLMLTGIFSRLGRRGINLRELCLAISKGTLGIDNEGSLIRGIALYTDSSTYEQMHVVIAAMELSDIQVKILRTETPGRHINFSEGFTLQAQSNFIGVVQQLESLNLGIGIYAYSSSNETTGRYLRKCLNRASKLEHLQLHATYNGFLFANESFRTAQYGPDLMAVRIPLLKSISLKGFEDTLRDLVAFLRHHEGLKTATLIEMTVLKSPQVTEVDQEEDDLGKVLHGLGFEHVEVHDSGLWD